MIELALRLVGEGPGIFVDSRIQSRDPDPLTTWLPSTSLMRGLEPESALNTKEAIPETQPYDVRGL